MVVNEALQETDALHAGRRGDGGVYLVAADESPEFDVALRYAERLAVAGRGRLAVLQVLRAEDFQHWGAIEERIRSELRTQAELFLWNVARRVNESSGLLPVLDIAEGNPAESLIEAINADQAIRMLVLGAQTGAGGPGPLVSYFTGKGLARLRVPVLVVPGHLELQVDLRPV